MDKKEDGKLMGKMKLKKKADSATSDFIISWKKTNSIIAGIFTLIVISALPLVFRDYYFDILRVKYAFYYGTVLLMLAVTLIVAIIYIRIDNRLYKWANMKQICKGLTLRSLRKCDWAMIIFIITVAVSTFQSEYIYESFWGNEGRYMGLFLFLLYGASYFIISRFLSFRQWYLDAFLAAGMIACIIGILQYFKIDPIGFKAEIDPREYRMFTSTIGNINTYTSYLALISGMAVVLFTIEKNIYRRIWYLFNVIVSLFALITGISDNVYLALLALYGLLPLYLFSNIKGVKKYILLLAILFTEFQITGYINKRFSAHVLGIDGIFDIIAEFEYLAYLVILLWGAAVCLYIWDAHLSKKGAIRKERNTGRWIWLGVIVCAALSVCYALYDVNIAGNTERYGSLKTYLFIDDNWGTHRWYIWRIGMESYEKFPLIHKIFGYGPDTFGIITVKNYYEEMKSRYHEIFDSAHNEYLQYLITIGIVGLAAYLSLLFTSIVQMLRSSKKTPALMAIVFALVCYGAQAAVNISIPIVSPIMMTLLMIGVSVDRRADQS